MMYFFLKKIFVEKSLYWYAHKEPYDYVKKDGWLDF